MIFVYLGDEEMLLKVKVLWPASLWIRGSRTIGFKWPKGMTLTVATKVGPIKVCITMQVWVGVFALSLFNGGKTNASVCVLHSLWTGQMRNPSLLGVWDPTLRPFHWSPARILSCLVECTDLCICAQPLFSTGRKWHVFRRSFPCAFMYFAFSSRTCAVAGKKKQHLQIHVCMAHIWNT